jgi:hypothetical protein
MEARQRPWSSADFSKGAAMGFLGIMRDPRGVAFQLPELNVNLWVLPGLFGRRVVYLDVGIHLRAPSESALSSFVLLLPGGTGEEVVDLATSLTDPKVAKLIFGEQVEIDVNEGRLCFVEGEDVEILPISKTETSKVAAKSDSNFSHWHIQLARTVRETAYVRLRFRVRTRGRMLLIRGFGMFASRILIDFRVSDLRESVTVPDQAIYQQALLPIEKLTCHAILPTRFRAPPVGASTLVLPPRLLEGTVWESYLGRATYLLRQGKLTVFPWHHDDRITLNRPFRAFIDVARDTPVLLPLPVPARGGRGRMRRAPRARPEPPGRWSGCPRRHSRRPRRLGAACSCRDRLHGRVRCVAARPAGKAARPHRTGGVHH